MQVILYKEAYLKMEVGGLYELYKSFIIYKYNCMKYVASEINIL